MYAEKVLKMLAESRKRGGDDFDIVERASIRSMTPRLLVKQIYDSIINEEKIKRKKVS
tara:strand:- start:577 stop:750 length:174 start_codon:yes stop_codon:yes gene_type:complete